ncbi:putative tRNA isopentenyltransferase [Trypanosoma vivax]|uniref:Putative tRNA isopentenyltransferase n=1 Tax=Trypanosoma vivax (strain Y486) TaxID=1055687 RepID=G0TTH2_TRYVY|nr:putative tRNA isopentenyltransferase [Trypanosoma vivax]CCC47253.1 putative tRNA isopentenyltransferase [Trypanosoma vivax Y486]
MPNTDINTKKSIFFVLGPTGCGKSLAAVWMAKTLRMECKYEYVVIVNCDVMQFYADLSVATNKISIQEMEGIPHCFIGFLSPYGEKVKDPTILYDGHSDVRNQSSHEVELDSYNIHSYVHDVTRFIEKVFGDHSSAAVIICGGTCYYAQAIMFDNLLTKEDDEASLSLSSVEQSSPVICEDEQLLWDKLNEVDPEIAAQYHPNNTRRIRRLLDIYKKTKRMPSDIFKSRSSPCFRFNPEECFVLWLQFPMEKLKSVLEGRVDKMVSNGIVEEILAFSQRYGGNVSSFPLSRAIGFKEFISAFDTKNGEVHIRHNEIRGAIELMKTNTKRYAKQQIRWIKNRFVRHLGHIFISANVTENFVAIDVYKNLSEFKEMIEKTAKFFTRCSTEATDLLFPLKSPLSKCTSVQHEWCDKCEIFFIGGTQREVHFRSKRHLGAIKREALAKQLERHGRGIPHKRQRIG